MGTDGHPGLCEQEQAKANNMFSYSSFSKEKEGMPYNLLYTLVIFLLLGKISWKSFHQERLLWVAVYKLLHRETW